MRPSRQAPDAHTLALQRALLRWENDGNGKNIFLCVHGFRRDLIDRAMLYIGGKYPTVGSMAMSRIFCGNGPEHKGLGLTIDYIDINYFVKHDFGPARGLDAFIELLDEAMSAHTLSHGEKAALNQFIEYNNSKLEKSK